jgi:beta-1,2-mannobiose phosphorylase / 1,2-beta-oligomannan phosphorylase
MKRPLFSAGLLLACVAALAPARAEELTPRPPVTPSQLVTTTAGWVKYTNNPVLGGQYGTCFDVSVLKEGERFRMWFSWRPKASIALVESPDGFHWSEPVIVLGPNADTTWEKDINRPVVLKKDGIYHLWYSAFNEKGSALGYATSPDGRQWKRMQNQPVLSPEQPWEKQCLMCPHVLWDEEARLFKMWYSGGERNEPNAIGYATSPDGLQWTKLPANPIFTPDPRNDWEQHKVTACQVVRQEGWYVMFYIGFRDEQTAQIGLARSRDGITHWQRHWANPIIRRGPGQWDQDACYKPYALWAADQWMLWYNGRRGGLEQIGVALHPGRDLGFEDVP